MRSASVPSGEDRDPASPPAAPSVAAMAASLGKAALTFAASGFQIVDQDAHLRRVTRCAECRHRRNTRCVVCGCFFDKKAWLPHEDCPIGNWPV